MTALTNIFGSEVTEAQVSVSRSFVAFEREFVKGLDAVFEVKTRADKEGRVHLEDDYVQFLVKDGVLDPNIKSAMAVAAYESLVASGKDSASPQTEESIQRLLGLDEEEYVAPEVYALFPPGVRRQSIVADMGKSAYSVLNLKEAPEADVNDRTKLETALGAWAYEALKKRNFVIEHPAVTAADVKNAYGPVGPEDISKLTNETWQLAEFQLSDGLTKILENNKKSSSFTSKVFGTNPENPMPSLTPEKATKQVTNSTQQVPEAQQRTLTKDQKRPYRFKANVASTFMQFSKDIQMAMMGYVHDDSNTLDINLPKVNGKNRSIEREIDTARDFYEEIVNQEDNIKTNFFFKHTVWAQGRMGIINKFNPQSSKIHRYLVERNDWQNTFKFGDAYQEEFFLLAVGEGFDIETAKDGSAEAARKTNDKLSDPDIRAAIDVMKQLIRDDEDSEGFSQANQDIIAKGVKAGKTKMKSYQSIVAMAEYEIAKESGAKDFTHSLSREVDGITNGVCITAIQFATENLGKMFNVLNRMGIYAEDTTFNDWSARPENQDSYKSLARDWELAIQNGLRTPRSKAEYNMVSKLFGSFATLNKDTGEYIITDDGRKIAKSPLMTSIYGASIKSIIDNLGGQAVDKIYDRIEKVLADTATGKMTNSSARTELNQVQDIIFEMTGSRYQITSKNIKKFKLKKGDVKKIKTMVSDVYSAPLKSAMDVDYKESFETRAKLNTLANLSHEMFMQLYDIAKAEMLAEEGVTSLTVEMEQKLYDQTKGWMPIVDTAISKESNKRSKTQTTLDTGMLLSNYKSTPVTDGSIKVTIESSKLVKGKTSRFNGQARVWSEPGAKAVPMLTTGIDAYVQLTNFAKTIMLNVHDASYFGSKEFAKEKEIANQAFAKANLEYSTVDAIVEMFERIENSYSTYGITPSDEVMQKATKALGLHDGATITDVRDTARQLADTHIANKTAVMNAMKTIEQYSNGEDSGWIRKFGSASNTDAINNAEYGAAQKIDKFNSEQVFDELQKTSEVKDDDAHLEHLRNVLTDVVNQSIQPMNLYVANDDSVETIGVTDGIDVRIVNQTQGSTPKSGLLANGIRMSASEVYVHELVHAVSHVGLSKFSTARQELENLYKQARKVITVRDFMNDPEMLDTDPAFKDEYEAAKKRHDYIFKPTKSGSKKSGRNQSNYLDEFLTFGVTNKNFMKAMSKIEYSADAGTSTDAETGLGRLAQDVQNFFIRLLNKVNSWLMSTKDKTGDKQLDQLFRAFADADTSNKAQLQRISNKTLDVVTKPLEALRDRTIPGINKYLAEPVLKFKDRTVTDVKQKMSEGKIKTFTDITYATYKELAAKDNTAANIFLSTVTEARGRFDAVGLLHDMKRFANKNIDVFRRQMRSDIGKGINDAFVNKLSQEAKSALSKVLLKTDVVSLLGSMSKDDATNMIVDKAVRKAKIAELVAELSEYKGLNSYYIKQAKNLGKFMNTGVSNIPNAMLNAKNIADALGTHLENPKFARKAEPIIDQLATLYALDGVSDLNRNMIAELISQESTRTDDGNGIHFVLDLMAQYAKRTDVEFAGNTRHIQKGFMSDKVNPNIDVRYGTLADQAKYESEGYTREETPLPIDPTDPNPERRYLYVNRHGSPTAHIGGVAYQMTQASRGTSVVQDAQATGADFMTELDLQEMKNNIKRYENFNSAQIGTRSYAVPLVDEAGNIVDYRYVMQDRTKDDILERDTSFDDVMGIMFSGLAVKNRMRDQNSQLVEVLRKIYKEDIANKDNYVAISPRSSNPEHQEIYRLLPQDMKDKIRNTWGGEVMYVRRDAVDLLFGYHKYSLANMWKLPKEERKLYQQMFTGFVGMIFGKKAAMRVRQGEELIQALANTVKDIIVIKSGLVTLGNMMSNVLLLSMQGVPIKDIIVGHKKSYQGMRQHKRDNQELAQIQLKLATDLSKAKRSELEAELVRLEDRMANNPVIDLIDQGLLSTIVEDVNTEVEEYKLRQRVARRTKDTNWGDKFDAAVSKLPESVKTVGKEALVMQGSNLYDFLSEAAQFSDFGARYVLYNHKVNNKNPRKRLTPEQAAGEVMDIFIDYDLPTHQGLQYLNDIGILMFTKYLIRVQKIILKTFKDEPARALIVMLLNSFFLDGASITDSLMFFQTDPLSRITNPISSFLGTAPDLVTVSAFT